MVLRWIDQAWREIPVELITRSFKSCGISDALDGTEDDAVWDDEEEEAEDTEERIDNEFETDSEAEDEVAELSRAFKQTVLFRATPVLCRTNKPDRVNDERCLSFVYSLTGIYLHTHFSLLEKFGKLYFVGRKYSVTRGTPSFEQILIKQAYFLLKNGAPYK